MHAKSGLWNPSHMYFFAFILLKVCSRKHEFLFWFSLCLEDSTLQDFCNSSSVASFHLPFTIQTLAQIAPFKRPFMTIDQKQFSPLTHSTHTALRCPKYSSLPAIIFSISSPVSPRGSLWQGLNATSSQTLFTEITGLKLNKFLQDFSDLWLFKGVGV